MQLGVNGVQHVVADQAACELRYGCERHFGGHRQLWMCGEARQVFFQNGFGGIVGEQVFDGGLFGQRGCAGRRVVFFLQIEVRSQLSALLDGAFRIQLCRDIRAANQVNGATGGFQARLQFAQRLLPCADNHIVHRQGVRLSRHGDVQAIVVNAVVLHGGLHIDATRFERGAVYPAGGFTQSFADLAGFALQQMHLARWRWNVRRAQTTRLRVARVHAPFGVERFHRIVVGAVVRDVFAHVKADTAGADDGDPFTDRLLVAQYVQIAQYFRVVNAVNRRCARNHAGGEHDGVVLTLREHLDGGAGVQLQIHAAQFDLAREVAQGFVEFVFARHFFGDVELSADFVRGFDQGDAVAAFGGGGGKGQTSGTRADHGDVFRRVGRFDF